MRSANRRLLCRLVWGVPAVLGCGGKVSPIGQAVDGGADSADGTGGGMSASPLVISTAARTPRTTTWSVNYWMWPLTYGDDVAGTEALVLPLAASVMRIGGYNNDANIPDPFDDTELDKASSTTRRRASSTHRREPWAPPSGWRTASAPPSRAACGRRRSGTSAMTMGTRSG